MPRRRIERPREVTQAEVLRNTVFLTTLREAEKHTHSEKAEDRVNYLADRRAEVRRTTNPHMRRGLEDAIKELQERWRL
jgi:hypothetical protein